MLSVLTFTELSDEIDQAMARANSQTKKAAWATLKRTVRDAESAPQGGDELDPGARSDEWWLLGIEVLGFRGISATQLTIDFDPSPGITVIHGPNGSGKSSICDAIDVALHQDLSASLGRLSGTGGRAPVWEPVLLHSESSQAGFRIRLLSTRNQVLTLETQLDGETLTQATSTISDRDTPNQTVSLGEAWRSALSAYSPTYAYATWEQRIQLAQDLQRYLEKMLILGGCFLSVDHTIEDRKQSSVAADRQITAARQIARRRIQDAELEFGRTSSINLDFAIGDDPAVWWAECGLPDVSVDQDVELVPIDTENLLKRTASARQALSELTQETKVDAALLHALHELSRAVSADSELVACPVCGTAAAWRESLDATVHGNDSVIRGVREWNNHLTELLHEARSLVPRLIAASEPQHHDAISRAQELVVALERGLSLSAPIAHEIRSLAVDLMNLVTFQDFTDQAAIATERASAESAWLRRQCIAVADLRATWITERESALELPTWVEARRCLDDLEKRLKIRRQESLESATNKMVTALLRDAGLVISDMDVQKRQAKLVLRDESGRNLELGMLSAGQRNAVLLAPALAVAAAGPFRFIVIDDPVHAFDELRVDQIARQLIELSRTRRVIVLTHDERLREHLLASPTPVDSRSVRRDPLSGEIEVREVGPIWAVLLEDAEVLSELSDTARSGRLLLSNTIRGLCRQGVDNALRLMVTREAVRKLIDPSEWLALLDGPGIGTTNQRMEAVMGLDIGGLQKSRLGTARSILAPFMPAWNMAAHGNPPTEPVSENELKAAHLGCRELVSD